MTAIDNIALLSVKSPQSLTFNTELMKKLHAIYGANKWQRKSDEFEQSNRSTLEELKACGTKMSKLVKTSE